MSTAEQNEHQDFEHSRKRGLTKYRGRGLVGCGTEAVVEWWGLSIYVVLYRVFQNLGPRGTQIIIQYNRGSISFRFLSVRGFTITLIFLKRRDRIQPNLS